MKPIIDAHLDLAWNALHWNRDLTKSLAEVRQYESAMHDHPARGRATVTIPELHKAGVKVCLGTVLVRSKPEVVPAEGYSRRAARTRTPAPSACPAASVGPSGPRAST